MNKGQTGIELAVLGIMMLVGVLIIYFPVVLFKTTSTINIEYQYHYDNTQALLLSLLSTNVTTQQPTLELLGNYMQLSTQRPDITTIKIELGKLANAINVNCYKLSTSSPTTTTQSSTTSTSSTTTTASATDIITGSCTKYQASTIIPLPYSPGNLVKTVILVIEQ